MGWTGYAVTPGHERAEIEKFINFENDESRYRAVYLTQKGTTWYAAVEVTLANKDAETCSFEVDADGKYVFAAVFLTRRDPDGLWFYKDMDETVGPFYYQAPKKLLDMLSPTTNDSARKWRENCARHAALSTRPLKHGDVIKFRKPIKFQDGRDRDTFIVQKEKPDGYSRSRTYFLCKETGQHCRIKGFMQLEWAKLVPSAAN